MRPPAAFDVADVVLDNNKPAIHSSTRIEDADLHAKNFARMHAIRHVPTHEEMTYGRSANSPTQQQWTYHEPGQYDHQIHLPPNSSYDNERDNQQEVPAFVSERDFAAVRHRTVTNSLSRDGGLFEQAMNDLFHVVTFAAVQEPLRDNAMSQDLNR